ncbi:MAG: methylmalonyl-CoA mutase family protein, partial [Deltaproteobacteria bacterium]
LTDKIEEEARKVMQEVEEVGGMEEAIESEWLDRIFEKEAVERQKEVDNGEKLVVGINIFTSEAETTTPLGVQRIREQSAREQIQDVIEFKRTRDKTRLNEAIRRLRDDVSQGKNTIPAMIEATKAGATTAELLGTVREVYGYQYDPLGVLESPFK